ncbi:MAG: carboxypeptidase regulatory-like domain-containing protein [Saprospiraceae bacterium]|nr:carboxypeptidase regulatory-like domain-containing protein [Saprospiraceae bacterium]
MKKVFYFLFLSLALASCHKDTEETTIFEEVYTPPVIKINGNIAGLVVNENGDPIEGATVQVGNQQLQTGPGGYFIFRNIVLNANGTYIKVDQPGYFHASRRFYPKLNAMNYTTLTLMAKNNTGQVSATTGGIVNVLGGATVKLPANGIAKADGTLYTGQVQVAARWLDPTADNLTDIMPGNLHAINSRQEEVALATFGMMAVELTGTDGSRLNLANGSKAELSIQIPSQLQSNAPNEIPLWHFDETTGLWREEGFAVRQGNAYVGEVSHFSFWNWDVPYPLVNIEGTILSPDGNPLSNVWLRVTVLGTVVTGYGTVDDNGYFNGGVPAGQALLLEAIDPCGQVLVSENIGPFTSDTSLGNLTAISGSTFNYTTVIGSMVNCDNDPVTNGILRICQGGNCNLVATGADGSVEAFLAYCGSGDISVTAFDLDTQLQSTTQNYPAAETIEIGAFAACATQITEFIRLNIDGDEVIYPLPYAYGQPGALRYIGAFAQDSSYTFSLSFPVGAPGSYTGAGVSFSSQQISPTYFAGFCQNPCGDVTVTVTEFGNIGEFIRGTFSGNVDFSDINQQVFPNLPVSGEFAVIRLQ